jgi:hypothetical protein
MATKPDDIPQDVWDAAASVFNDLDSPNLDYRAAAHEVSAARVDDIRMIARAIQTEREACAATAAEAMKGHRPAGIDADLWPDPAAAILSRGSGGVLS